MSDILVSMNFNSIIYRISSSTKILIVYSTKIFVSTQGYKHKRAFIVAEGPMKSTVRNFWKMIYERNCAVVVMTSSLVEGGQEASAQYWPDSGIAHYGEFAVDLLGEEKLQGFVIRNLSVMDTKVC